MLFYIVRRIGLAFLIVFLGVSSLFVLLQLIPGDPIDIALGPRATPEVRAEYAAKMHLDESVFKQYLIYIGNVIRGDLGRDLFSDREVSSTIGRLLPFTLTLAITSLGWAILVAIPLGCYSAVKPNSWVDRVSGLISVGSIAIPSFLVSIWSILLFSITLRWLPVVGAGEPGNFSDQVSHLILPAFAVGLGWVGYLARMVRASMLEVLSENYIKSAQAYGLPRRVIIFKYALRVAVLPTITLIGIGFGGLLSGAVFAEIIFARPGIGQLILDMVNSRNFPVIQGAVLVTVALYAVVTLISDLAIAILDPRVRHAL